MVRAKFKVESHETRMSYVNGGGHVRVTTVKLRVVHGGSEENKSFFSATPNGCIELGLVSAETAAHFPLDAEVYVDFTQAPAAT